MLRAPQKQNGRLWLVKKTTKNHALTQSKLYQVEMKGHKYNEIPFKASTERETEQLLAIECLSAQWTGSW